MGYTMAMIQISPGNAKKLFYEPVHPLFNVLQIFVKGDALIIAPFLCGIVLVGLLYSWPLSIFIMSVFYAVRQFGEMIYWLFQQFHDHSYRPYDFGLTLLNTHSIYILYQVSACVQSTIGIVLACIVYLKYLS
jgi:hypothetical protein